MRYPKETTRGLARWDTFFGCNPHMVCSVCLHRTGTFCKHPDHQGTLYHPDMYACTDLEIDDWLKNHIMPSPYKTDQQQKELRKQFEVQIDITIHTGSDHKWKKKLGHSVRIDNIDPMSFKLLKTSVRVKGEKIEYVFGYPKAQEVKRSRKMVSFPLKYFKEIDIYKNGVRKVLSFEEFKDLLPTGKLLPFLASF